MRCAATVVTVPASTHQGAGRARPVPMAAASSRAASTIVGGRRGHLLPRWAGRRPAGGAPSAAHEPMSTERAAAIHGGAAPRARSRWSRRRCRRPGRAPGRPRSRVEVPLSRRGRRAPPPRSPDIDLRARRRGSPARSGGERPPGSPTSRVALVAHHAQPRRSRCRCSTSERKRRSAANSTIASASSDKPAGPRRRPVPRRTIRSSRARWSGPASVCSATSSRIEFVPQSSAATVVTRCPPAGRTARAPTSPRAAPAPRRPAD